MYVEEQGLEYGVKEQLIKISLNVKKAIGVKLVLKNPPNQIINVQKDMHVHLEWKMILLILIQLKNPNINVLVAEYALKALELMLLKISRNVMIILLAAVKQVVYVLLITTVLEKVMKSRHVLQEGSVILAVIISYNVLEVC